MAMFNVRWFKMVCSKGSFGASFFIGKKDILEYTIISSKTSSGTGTLVSKNLGRVFIVNGKTPLKICTTIIIFTIKPRSLGERDIQRIRPQAPREKLH
jgi:hypothetical protein